MLIKKELGQIPPLKFPAIPRDGLKGRIYVAAAQIVESEKCGKILAVDVFKKKGRSLRLRFFCDGKNYLVCEEWPAKQWRAKRLKSFLNDCEVASKKSDDNLALNFFNPQENRGSRGQTLAYTIDQFAYEVYSEKYGAAMKKKYELRNKHFSMYPKYPDDLTLYCDLHVFEHTYIFISKKENGRRKAVCGHCGRRFQLPGDNTASGTLGMCPKCGMRAKYFGDWRKKPIERTKICIAHKAEGHLLLRWAGVNRTYDKEKCRYYFYDYYRSVYTQTPKGESVYSYRYFANMSWGWDWFRKKNGEENNEEVHMYAFNLNEVFGEPYCHVNLRDGLINAGKISFPRLLYNLKNNPVTEYLFKLGLTNIAANAYETDLLEGSGFSEVLGVKAQYLPLYKKYNVSVKEHQIIKCSKTWVNSESFEKLRMLLRDDYIEGDIIGLLEGMSLERFANYFTKQKRISKKKLKFLVIQYRDYIDMSVSLKVDLSGKSVRFPAKLTEAHDAVLERYNAVKHEIEDENFKQAVEKLYAGMEEYSKGLFCIVLPKLRIDLIKEGQSLSHCVGGESYYKSHIKGSNMIFFIRKIDEPEKPFFTMEIDMHKLTIRQIHGYANRSAPKDVMKFANEFLRQLKPAA